MKYTLDFKNKVIILLEKCNLGELCESLDEDKRDWDLVFNEHIITNSIVRHPTPNFNKFIEDVVKQDVKDLEEKYPRPKITYVTPSSGTVVTNISKEAVQDFIKRFS